MYLQGVWFDGFIDHKALIYMVRAQSATNNGRLMQSIAHGYPDPKETRHLNKMKEKVECKDTMATLAGTETE